MVSCILHYSYLNFSKTEIANLKPGCYIHADASLEFGLEIPMLSTYHLYRSKTNILPHKDNALWIRHDVHSEVI